MTERKEGRKEGCRSPDWIGQREDGEMEGGGWRRGGGEKERRKKRRKSAARTVRKRRRKGKQQKQSIWIWYGSMDRVNVRSGFCPSVSFSFRSSASSSSPSFLASSYLLQRATSRSLHSAPLPPLPRSSFHTHTFSLLLLLFFFLSSACMPLTIAWTDCRSNQPAYEGAPAAHVFVIKPRVIGQV